MTKEDLLTLSHFTIDGNFQCKWSYANLKLKRAKEFTVLLEQSQQMLFN